MSDETRAQAATGGGGGDAFIMLLSAAIFGYFGFYMKLSTHDAAGVLVPAWAVLVWTLKAACVGFALSGALAIARQSTPANLLYALVSVLSAVAFLVVVFLDYRDAYGIAIPPFLLIIFAAWNGYGGWMGLRPLLRSA